MCIVIRGKRKTRKSSYGFFQMNTRAAFDDEDEELFSASTEAKNSIGLAGIIYFFCT